MTEIKWRKGTEQRERESMQSSLKPALNQPSPPPWPHCSRPSPPPSKNTPPKHTDHSRRLHFRRDKKSKPDQQNKTKHITQSGSKQMFPWKRARDKPGAHHNNGPPEGWGGAYYKTANTGAPHFITHVPTVNCTMLVVLCSFLFFLAHDHTHALSHHDGVSRCIAGPLHKHTPSPEGPEYVECLSWKENSCCTANFTAELQKNRVENLYNFSWNHCGNLTKVSPAWPQY